MASIVFGAGTSHTPMLNMTAEEWPLFEEVDRHRAHLHTDGRAATYDDLLAAAPASVQAEITPDKHTRRHGEAMAALDRLRDGLAGAALDAVIVVGDDHKEIYHDDNMPSVLVYRGETIANVPNRTGAAPAPRRWAAAAQLDAARRRALLRGERDAALSCARRPRQSSDHGAGRARVRRVVGQRACRRAKARGTPSASSTAVS